MICDYESLFSVPWWLIQQVTQNQVYTHSDASLTVVEVVVRVLSASAVYSVAQYLLFLGKATQHSIVLRE